MLSHISPCHILTVSLVTDARERERERERDRFIRRIRSATGGERGFCLLKGIRASVLIGLFCTLVGLFCHITRPLWALAHTAGELVFVGLFCHVIGLF